MHFLLFIIEWENMRFVQIVLLEITDRINICIESYFSHVNRCPHRSCIAQSVLHVLTLCTLNGMVRLLLVHCAVHANGKYAVDDIMRHCSVAPTKPRNIVSHLLPKTRFSPTIIQILCGIAHVHHSRFAVAA